MKLDFIEKIFNEYANEFDMDNYDISYKHKHKHSYRVKDISNYIASNLDLSDEDIYLASIIGLLHDIGRFKQLEMFGNYEDLNIDHADLGVKILFEDNLIEKFNIDKKYYEIIKFAIKNHNKLNIEIADNDRMQLHAKIIRDADKIDILKAFTIYKDYKLPECSDNVSEKVNDSFYKCESVKSVDKGNLNDKIISVLAFIYDINFKVSLDLIKEENIIDNLYSNIENKEMFKSYFEYISNYLEER